MRGAEGASGDDSVGLIGKGPEFGDRDLFLGG